MKKVIIFLLVLVMLFSLAACNSSSAGDKETQTGSSSDVDTSSANGGNSSTGDEEQGTQGDNITWHFEDGTLYIEGTGDMPDFVPGEPGWYEVAEKTNKVVIGEGITRIGSYALYRFLGVTEFDFADSITEIASSAITCDRENLHSLELPENLIKIGGLNFFDCKNVESLELPDTLQYIGEGSLPGVKNDVITIPASVTECYDFCGAKEIHFEGDAPLMSVREPGDYTANAFETHLEHIGYYDGITIYYSSDTFDEFVTAYPLYTWIKVD